jgi:hypothetical protein
MLEKSFSILFYLKKPKGYEKGAMPIYVRITVDGVPKELATKRTCEPNRWNSDGQRVRGTNEESRSLNAFLDTLARQIHDARTKLIEAKAPITTDNIKNVLTGQYERPRMLLEMFQQHNSQMAALADKEYAAATVKRYETTLEHTRAFITWKYNVTDIDITRLSFDFATNFEFWLKSVRKCNHNSAIKYIGNLRKIVNYCLKSGWLPKDPFFGFKMAKKEVVREFLSEVELQALAEKQFAVERLAQVRDIFLFSCYTGLAFIDVFQLTPLHIATGIVSVPKVR